MPDKSYIKKALQSAALRLMAEHKLVHMSLEELREFVGDFQCPRDPDKCPWSLKLEPLIKSEDSNK